MLYQGPIGARSRQALITRQRFAFAGALVLAGFLPFALRMLLWPDYEFIQTSLVALAANIAAVTIALWIRLSVGTFPGVRSGTLIGPSITVAHAIVLIALIMTRLPYDRLALLLAFIFHLVWITGLHIAVHRRIRRRFAVVPCGSIDHLGQISDVDWKVLKRARLADVEDCDALVADFTADLPPEWEAFLADAALDGRMVFQVKQLIESLTGKVEVHHLSENNFGSLLPARGYFHLKSVIDFGAAVMLLPVLIVPMMLIGLAIRLDSEGPALFRQERVGYAGRPIVIYKFRTMRPTSSGTDERLAAMTGAEDARITRVGAFLRRTRIDELPQIINILKREMSWIGPRPEAAVLSTWYTADIPFYRYRHVVKPGISGWAQVNQGHVAAVNEVYEKLQFDFFYLKYFSPWLDTLVLLRTIKTMLTGFGSK